MLLAPAHANWVGNFAAQNPDIQNFLRPFMTALIGLAGVTSAFFLIVSGIQYMTSSGQPDKLEHAKKVMRNALIGLVLVIAAGTLTQILSNAYDATSTNTVQSIPSLEPVDAEEGGGGITEILVNAIIGLFRHIIETAAKPFIAALEFFTTSTPLMGDNSSVFKLWLAVLGIANSLFVLVIALLGFQVMSAASLGLDEIDFKQLLPKLGATFLLMNSSFFLIDIVIEVSNQMIAAVQSTFESLTVWDALSSVAENAGVQGFVALMIMVVFMILTVMLLVYYVMRIVTLYVGAILSPLISLLSVLPGFKDFASTAVKAYLTTIFVLFVHAIILLLSATLFEGVSSSDVEQAYDPVMSVIIGVASLLALLKTQGVMMQMSYVSVGPKALRRLGGEFSNGIAYMSKVRSSRTVASSDSKSNTPEAKGYK